jgi:hypothetical protein
MITVMMVKKSGKEEKVKGCLNTLRYMVTVSDANYFNTLNFLFMITFFYM